MLRHLISGSIISNLACRIRPKDFSLTGVRLLKSWVSLKCESNFAYKKCEPPTPFDRRFSSAINKPLTVDLHTEDNLIYDRTDGPREIVLELDQILNSTKNNSKIMKLYEHLRGDGNGAKKIVGYWFLGSSALIFGIVILGGLTRLTESGLSMVDWNLIHFSPPQTDAAWAAYFDQYKMYPEFLANHDGQMTIEEFKRIYYMEHAHRVYGRLLGLFIIVPSIFFAVYKRADFINSKTIRKMTLGCSALVIFQGLLGWYMVKSGLEKEILENNSKIARVSPYRLAAHLTSAILLYILTLSNGLHILGATRSSRPSVPRQIKRMVHPLASLALLTVISGAFVAGLDAGMIYNDFPLMGGQLMPSDLIDTQLKPSIRNFTENATTVQFVHRILGISTVLGFTTLFLMARRANSLSLTKSINLMRHSTPNISNKNNFNSGYLGAIKLSTGLAWTQATLGVSTLLGGVPILLASAHQATSLILIASIVHLIRQM